MPKSRRWRENQRKTIGGSSAAAVLGLHPYRTAEDVAESMTGPLGAELEGPDLDRGHYLEPLALKLVSKDLGRRVRHHRQTAFIYHPDYPFAHALPDGWADGDPDADGNPVPKVFPLEVKAPRPHNWQAWFEGGFPGYHRIQVLHTLMVTGAQVGHLYAIHPVTMALLHLEIPREEEYIALMAEIQADFFRRVQTGEALRQVEIPEPPGGEGGALEPVQKPSAIEAVRIYIETRKIAKEAKATLDLAESAVREALNGHTAALLTDDEANPVAKIYLRPQAGKRSFKAKLFFRDHPRLAERAEAYWKTGKPSTPLRVFEVGGKEEEES